MNKSRIICLLKTILRRHKCCLDDVSPDLRDEIEEIIKELEENK